VPAPVQGLNGRSSTGIRSRTRPVAGYVDAIPIVHAGIPAPQRMKTPSVGAKQCFALLCPTPMPLYKSLPHQRPPRPPFVGAQHAMPSPHQYHADLSPRQTVSSTIPTNPPDCRPNYALICHPNGTLAYYPNDAPTCHPDDVGGGICPQWTFCTESEPRVLYRSLLGRPKQ